MSFLPGTQRPRPKTWTRISRALTLKHRWPASVSGISVVHVRARSDPRLVSGYGLPIARLYSQYFGGNLKLISMEGCVKIAHAHRLSSPHHPVDFQIWNGRLPAPVSTFAEFRTSAGALHPSCSYRLLRLITSSSLVMFWSPRRSGIKGGRLYNPAAKASTHIRWFCQRLR